MYIPPYQTDSPSGIPNIPSIPSVGDDPTEAQLAAQSGFYMGYLAELCDNGSGASPSPGVLAEIQRIATLYFGSGGYLNTVTDSTMNPIIKALMATLAPDGTVNSITPATEAAFFKKCTDPSQNYLLQVMTWFAPSGGGTPGYSFDSNTNQDTVFAFTMFMTSFDLLQGTAIGSQYLNEFMGYSCGPVNCWYWSGDFLAGYAYLHDSTGALAKLISNILPQDTAKNLPNYDQFVSYFQNNYATWDSNLPPGETPQEKMNGDYIWYLYALQNPPTG
ncbi:MAG TPA: hypothetical protein VLE89_03050 [Chlamydiales bacterium]|nr:hypothetical protein [Chlamydiales bacterium]